MVANLANLIVGNVCKRAMTEAFAHVQPRPPPFILQINTSIADMLPVRRHCTTPQTHTRFGPARCDLHSIVALLMSTNLDAHRASSFTLNTCCTLLPPRRTTSRLNKQNGHEQNKKPPGYRLATLSGDRPSGSGHWKRSPCRDLFRTAIKGTRITGTFRSVVLIARKYCSLLIASPAHVIAICV